jgi:eukaryotic-like serine/threonine-protein kinase
VRPGENDEVFTADGRRLQLGALIKSGGAGSVFRLRADRDCVAKIYHPDVDHAVYARKLEAMLRLSPQLPRIDEAGHRYVQIAWPQSLLRDGRGRLLGFLMPALDIAATAELELVMQERQARAQGLPTGLGPKVTLAANLAGVIAELHRQGHRVVDMKPVNLRFYRQSLYMAMLDCDGFSIQGEGERFPAPQYTGDYLAPELQPCGVTVAGEEAQDRFALAVIVFQLLNFGIHPFTGRPADEDVPTDIPSRIAARLHAYGSRPNPRLAPSLSSGHAHLPADLRRMFEAAFEASPAQRPTPANWADVLRGYAQRSRSRLLTCTRDRDHQHFAGQACAACAREIVLSNLARASQRPAAAPGARAAPAPVPATRSRIRRQPLPASILKQARNAPRTPAPPARPRHSWSLPSSSPPPAMPRRGAVKAAAVPGSPKARKAATLTFQFIGVILIVAFVIALDRPAPDEPASTYREPAALAQPPVQAPEVPSAWSTTEDLPAVRDFDVVETYELARAVALARARRQDETATFAMAALRGERPATLRTSDDGRFLDLARRFGGSDAPSRARWRGELYSRVRNDPLDAWATCEWGWLAMAAGQRSAAATAFARSLWIDPEDGCGWLGLAALSPDRELSLGALVQADGLQHYDANERAARDVFIRKAMEQAGIDASGFASVSAQAREHALAPAAPPAQAPSG